MTTIKTIRRVVFGPTQDEDLNAMMAENVAKIEATRALVPATKQLRTNLERVTLAYNDRERVLVKEIAEREAELTDVRRARDATMAALMELDVDLPELEVTDEAPPAPIGIDAVTGKLRFEDDQTQTAVEAARVPWKGVAND